MTSRTSFGASAARESRFEASCQGSLAASLAGAAVGAPAGGSGDYDGAASRAYYAVFHAFSALFADEDRTFVKHSQLEAAVHRDLVRGGRMDAAIGKAFSTLREYRARGDYGGQQHVNEAAARLAVRCAAQVLEAIQRLGRGFE